MFPMILLCSFANLESDTAWVSSYRVITIAKDIPAQCLSLVKAEDAGCEDDCEDWSSLEVSGKAVRR